MYKPEGYNSVSPYLIVGDLDVTLKFLREVFGCEPLFLHRGEDGSIAHVEVRIDDTIVMLGQTEGGPQAHVHVYVPDVDQAFQSAIAAGGRVVQEPMEKGDGDRRGGISDPGGTTWWLSTQITPR